MCNVIDLDADREANLRKLADYLDEFTPNACLAFTMSMYSESLLASTWVVDCGSIGCAIGHGPYAGIPKRRGEDWNGYSTRALLPGDYNHPGWIWMFSPDWVNVDDSPKGAAWRIRHLLAYGIPPACVDPAARYSTNGRLREALQEAKAIEAAKLTQTELIT